MKRFAVLAAAALTAVISASPLFGQEIETFDSPNELAIGNGNFAWGGPMGPGWTAAATTDHATYVEESCTGYGTDYHNMYYQNTNPVTDISNSTYLQLDVTINSGDSGLIVDLQDGEFDYWTYHFGYGLTGNAAADQSALGSADTGAIITQGALPNEEILDVPLNTPYSTGGTGFDFTQLDTFRVEDDPGGAVAYDIDLNDLSAVNLPEPASLSLFAGACLLAARRRK